MLNLNGHELRDVSQLRSAESGPQPILAIADQTIPDVEQANLLRQAPTPEDRWLSQDPDE